MHWMWAIQVKLNYICLKTENNDYVWMLLIIELNEGMRMIFNDKNHR